ncbi:FtsX-like permease family protein [Mumia flava]|uniref:FtsX-like permease family protein n=1 Tax=Mumia flava TaxID=1348852 RepID=A0A0B2B7X8_9ACTN|nr:FtsX-like permease family protein [Mumia flava]PJJ57538.1 FtsX-like permease family protein [Mumia flava]
MGSWGLGWRRARAHAWLLLAVAVTAAALTAVAGGLAALGSERSDRAVATALRAEPPRDAAVRVEAPSDLVDQVAAGDAVATTAVRAGLRATRSEVSDAFVADGRAVFAADLPDLGTRADLESGRWASTDDETTLPESAARRLGVGAGEVVRLGERTLRVTGTWRARDPRDPVWFADPWAGSGTEVGAAGPYVVSAATLATLPAARTTVWTFTVPPGTARDRLGALTENLLDTESEAADSQLRTEGGLGDRLEDVTRADAAVTAVQRAAAVLVLAVGAIALGAVLGTLRTARAREAELLRARGGSRVQRLLWHAGDAAAVGVLGWVAAAVAVGALVGPPGGGALTLCALVVLATCWAATGRGEPRAPSGAPALLGVLVVGGATLTAARLVTTGEVTATGPGGTPRPDVLAVVAPALVLGAAGLLAVALARPALGRATRLVARTSARLAPVLALRTVSRSPRAVGATVSLVALAVGTVVVAAVAAGATASLGERTRAASVGADVRVDLDVEPLVREASPAVDPDDFADLPGVAEVRPAVSTQARVADVETSLLAVGGAATDRTAVDADTEEGGVVPIDVSTDLADAVALAPGDRLDVAVPAATASFPAVVRGVTDTLDGIDGRSGIVADLDAVTAALTRPAPLAVDTLLLTSTDPVASADAVVGTADRPAAVTLAAGSSDGWDDVVRATWTWTGLGVAALAALGLTATVLASAAGRRRETAVLRALGAGASERVRSRLAELALTCTIGAVAGAVGAVVVGAAVIAPLARAIVPRGSPDLAFAPDPELGPLLAGVALLLAAVLVAASVTARVVAHQRGPGPREEDA